VVVSRSQGLRRAHAASSLPRAGRFEASFRRARTDAAATCDDESADQDGRPTAASTLCEVGGRPPLREETDNGESGYTSEPRRD
jgi:hypothetical protein